MKTNIHPLQALAYVAARMTLLYPLVPLLLLYQLLAIELWVSLSLYCA